MTSGQLPWEGDEMAYVGKFGTDITKKKDMRLSLATINAIAQFKDGVGATSLISKIISLEGEIHSGTYFGGHSPVLDGTSDYLNEMSGDCSGHTRTALRAHEMPLDSADHLSIWAATK